MHHLSGRFRTTMLYTTVFATLLVGAICGSVQDTNRYVDRVLGVEMPRELSSLDPWISSNYNVTLNATMKISAYFHPLNITGFRLAKRLGNCQNRRIGNRVNATCNVTFGHVVARANLTLRYTGRVFYNVGAVGTFTTIFSKFNATAQIGRPPFADLKLVLPLEASVKFTGLKNVPVSEALKKGFLNHLGDKISNFLVFYVQALNRAARKAPFPY
ncbi:secreted protein, putative [Ixodes scapularis]|uniref:Secreted protein, putative n=1 Tax=Ixodes scapularis TaxID=6945 RepID=B7PH23_IXOSC|nr:secreted protein, putative [Ixodes scapularis]|eukprot:XP_002401956.1 secreted protein, putative [Ixodes scapularis]